MNKEMKHYLKIGILAVALVLVVKYFTVILSGIGLILDAATPLVIGGVLAYILNLLMKQLEKFYFPNSKKTVVIKSRRPVCIVLALILMLCIIALVITLVVPELVSSFRLIGKEIPGIAENVVQWLVDHSDELPTLQSALENLDLDWPSIFKKTVNVVTSGATGVITSVVSVIGTTVGTIANIFIGLVFMFYLLFNKERLLNQLQRLLSAIIKPSVMEKITLVASTANHTFGNFIVGQFTEAIILGSLCAIGMLIFRFPYAVMTGTVIGVTALIPIVGAYIGAGLGAFMIFTVDPFQALLFLVFLVVLQQLEGNLIYPRVVGTSIGLPGMWVLAAITVGGGIMGVTGMLLGVPVAATIYKLLGMYVKNKEGDKAPDVVETAVSQKDEVEMKKTEQPVRPKNVPSKKAPVKKVNRKR